MMMIMRMMMIMMMNDGDDRKKPMVSYSSQHSSTLEPVLTSSPKNCKIGFLRHL